MLGKMKMFVDRNRSKTTAKKFGVNVKALAQQILSEEKQGFLDRDGFFLFWDALNDDREGLSEFLLLLLKDLLGVLRDNKKTGF